MALQIRKCRSCQAEIVFLKTQSGKWMPVDADTVDTDAEVLDGGYVLFKYGVHSSHFDSCGNSATHRKKKEPKTQSKPEEKQLELGDDGTVPF